MTPRTRRNVLERFAAGDSLEILAEDYRITEKVLREKVLRPFVRAAFASYAALGQDLYPESWSGKPRARAIVSTVARTHDMTVADIMGRSVKRSITKARHLAMWQVSDALGWSNGEVGKYFRRDASTVHSAIRRLRGEL